MDHSWAQETKTVKRETSDKGGLLDIQYASYPKPSQLWTFSPQTRWTMWSQQIRYFLFVSFLFFIFHPIKQGSPTPGELGCAAGGERQASEWSFICCAPSFPIARITTWTIPTPLPTPAHGKIVFHETSPWCQKSWGPLL